MSKRTYHAALELEKQALFDRATRLHAVAKHATAGDRVRYARQFRMLDERSHEIECRLRELEAGGNGRWADLMVDVKWIEDGLARALERWIEYIDAKDRVTHRSK